MDIIKIRDYIKDNEAGGLKVYLDSYLMVDDQDYLKVLLATVNTLLFEYNFHRAPEFYSSLFRKCIMDITNNSLSLDFIDQYISPDDPEDDIDDSYIQKAIKYINKNLDKDLNLDLMSSYVGLSKNYFSNLFKEVMGVSFIQYVNRKRIDKSKIMLKHSDADMALISKSCGFNSQSHFSATFSKLENMSPSQYRKENK